MDIRDRRPREILLVAIVVAALVALVLFRTARDQRGQPIASADAGARTSSAAGGAVDAPPAPGASDGREIGRPWGPIAARAPAVARDSSGGRSRVEGRVLSWATGAAVAGAELSFARGGAALSVTSSAGGAFRFEPPGAGTYRLAAVEADGFLPFAPAWGASPVAIEVREGTAIRDLTVYLAPAVEYVGIVLSPSKERIAGAEVRVSADGDFPLDEKRVTDREGEVHFQAPDGALIEAAHPGFALARARIDLASQVSRRVVLRLRDASEGAGRGLRRTISGRVLGPDGTAASGARVVASPISDNAAKPAESLRASRVAIAADDGAFVAEDLDDGTYRLTASLEGHAPAWVEPVKAGASGVLIKIGHGGVLTGHVRREGGAPITAFTLLVSRKQGGVERADVLAESRIDPEGAFEIRGLAPGAYVVSAMAHGLAPSGRVEVKIGAKPTDVVLTLGAGGCVRGVVEDEASGAPIAGARVSGEGDDEASPLPSGSNAVTGADGAFVLCGVAPGLRSLMAAAEGHHARLVSGLEVAEGATVGPIAVALPSLKGGEEPGVELVGIGAVLTPKGDAMLIGEILPGGGAAEAKLMPDDRIVEIDGESVVEIGFEDAIQRIRGKDGSTVLLGVERAGEMLQIVVHRRRIRR